MNSIHKSIWKTCLYTNKKSDKPYDLVIYKIANTVHKETYDKIFLALIVRG